MPELYRQHDTSDAALGYRFFFHRTGRARPQGPIDTELAGSSLTQIPAQFGVSARSMFQLPDFTAGFATAMGEVITTGLSAADHRQLCHPIAVPDFKEFSIPHLSINPGLAAIPEGGHYGRPVQLTLSQSLLSAGIEVRGSLLAISREVEKSDSIGLLDAALREIGRAVMLDEMQQLADLLESTDALSDGEPFLSSTLGNWITTGAAPSVTTLNAATEYLATATSATGERAGVLPAYLIVPPSLWTTALVLIAATMNVRELIRVICLPTLTSSTAWYVLGNPEAAPSIGLAYLGDPGDPPETFHLERVTTPATQDGATFRIRNALRYLPLSRLGVFGNDGS